MTEKPLGFGYQIGAGAIAGVSEILIMYPLDVVKTRVQLQGRAPVPGQDYYTGMFDCLRKIVKNEGPSRLYRGIGAPIMMEAPKRATKFAANDSWGVFYRNLFGVEKPLNPSRSLPARQPARQRLKSEGPLALYNGLESTLWRHILWNAGYFGCIFQVKSLMPKVDKAERGKAMLNDFISGTIGGTIGTILNTPMDVVKSRIQNSPKINGQVPKYNWAWPGLGTIMKEEGFAALYKGFLPKVLRLGPGGGVLLVVYTGVMDWFRKMGAQRSAEWRLERPLGYPAQDNEEKRKISSDRSR
ncbi:hypothetical protein CLAIMM_02720 [Cladophialophora immunda]|nr:hypothetical protein CLAIMM_02720 [Cladophialophora immunda]